jgi:type VI secretion system protein ImpF
MSSRELEPTVQQSILDRLIDLEPSVRADPPVSWNESVRRLRNALLRDLDWLLNTRRIAQPAPASFPEVQASVYHFGLPDITSFSGDSTETPEMLRRRIEDAIRVFEPRLTGVNVVAADAGADMRHRIRFTIDGLLRMEPNPERVTFDTVLEIGSGEFSVLGDENG